MNISKKLIVVALAASLLLTGCGGRSEISDNDDESSLVESVKKPDSSENSDRSESSDNASSAEGEAAPASDFEYTIEENSVTITKYIGKGGNVNIPKTIEGKPVTSINDWAFSGCEGLTSVTIPNNVTSINCYAFNECKSLTGVTIPNSVTYIDDNAFRSCTSLTSVTIPNSVTSIGSGAFGKTPWLKSQQKKNPLVVVNGILIDGKTASGAIIIPNSVTSIGSGAFYNCDSLTSVTIPNSVTSMSHNAFDYCNDIKITYKGKTYTYSNIYDLYETINYQ